MFKIPIIVLCIAVSRGSIIPSDDVFNNGDRIVGGETAPEGAVPYQASLRHIGSHICGGSIIGKRWIVTAAHCVSSTNVNAFTIAVGTNHISTGGTVCKVKRIIKHEAYSSRTLKNDIALFELTEDIVFNERVKAIGLPASNTDAGATLLLSGWGKTSHPGSPPVALQWLKVKSISVEECVERNGHLLPVEETNICTFTQEGQGACHGDSGGPLALQDELVGIVSWGNPCAKGNPDVFTRVFKYKDWISQNIN